jgi:diguanylate cyclase (GGDEF)-like protein
MLKPHRTVLLAAAIALAACTAAYVQLGAAKPVERWNWIDIASEGSIALMAGLWCMLVLTCRPSGRTTTLLASGLAGLMLGAWADCMDELFVVAKGEQWSHLLESGVTLTGMGFLTAGLLYWRQEQVRVSEHLHKRERLFRDHRAFDHLTQLADADYLREQLALELERGTAANCTLAMFDIDDFHVVNHDYGQREGDRLLQAVTHVLLLNLRTTDLLCRYAGDRFAVLMPDLEPEAARVLAEQLRRAIACLRHYPLHHAKPIEVTVRWAARPLDGNPRELLKELNRTLERRIAPGGPRPSNAAAAHA